MSESTEVTIASHFGEYLTNEYEILRRVFNYLTTLELISNCKQVCQEWNKAAYVTVKERRVIQCLLYTNEDKTPDFLCDAELTLYFVIRPQTAAEYCHSQRLSKLYHEFYARYGIIALIDENKPYSRRVRVEFPLTPITPKTYVRPSVRFPPWEGVTITTIYNDCNHRLTASEMDALLKLPDGSEIKAVIIISSFHEEESDEQTSMTEDNVKSAILCLRNRTKEFPLAGLKLDSAENYHSGNLFNRLYLIIFSGENVDAGSCVLDSYCRTQEAVDSRVDAFSKSVVHSKNSVLLVFRCCGRNKVRRRYNYQPRENVETWENNTIIKSFPMTSAVGCYGIGEYGVDFPELENSIKKPRLGQKEMNFEFEYSTILLYVQYKKK